MNVDAARAKLTLWGAQKPLVRAIYLADNSHASPNDLNVFIELDWPAGDGGRAKWQNASRQWFAELRALIPSHSILLKLYDRSQPRAELLPVYSNGWSEAPCRVDTVARRPAVAEQDPRHEWLEDILSEPRLGHLGRLKKLASQALVDGLSVVAKCVRDAAGTQPRSHSR